MLSWRASPDMVKETLLPGHSWVCTVARLNESPVRVDYCNKLSGGTFRKYSTSVHGGTV